MVSINRPILLNLSSALQIPVSIFHTFMKTLFVLLMPMLLFACSSTGTKQALNEIPASKRFTAEEFEAARAVNTPSRFSQSDVFRVGDTVDITVHGFDNFSGTYLVDRDGKTHFVHIGEIRTAGLSVTDLQNVLRQRYGDCCLNDPSISVKQETKKLGVIVVDGAVDKPGAFELAKIIKLSEAIALAGGANDVADRKEVILAREINNERKIMVVNLENIQVLGQLDPLIYPNDVIYVQDNRNRVLYNEFLRALPLASLLYNFSR